MLDILAMQSFLGHRKEAFLVLNLSVGSTVVVRETSHLVFLFTGEQKELCFTYVSIYSPISRSLIANDWILYDNNRL
jgi:hypothetical protein